MLLRAREIIFSVVYLCYCSQFIVVRCLFSGSRDEISEYLRRRSKNYLYFSLILFVWTFGTTVYRYYPVWSGLLLISVIYVRVTSKWNEWHATSRHDLTDYPDQFPPLTGRWSQYRVNRWILPNPTNNTEQHCSIHWPSLSVACHCGNSWTVHEVTDSASVLGWSHFMSARC